MDAHDENREVPVSSTVTCPHCAAQQWVGGNKLADDSEITCAKCGKPFLRSDALPVVSTFPVSPDVAERILRPDKAKKEEGE